MSVRIINADVREGLRSLPSDSVDCVVTSPPYWGLRDYGVVGQIGLEPTLGEHLTVMVDVMREVRRVMKPTATLWLNYGDCYATTPNGRSAADTKAAGNDDRTFRDKPSQGVLKAKDLCMVPNRLAIALQEDGWWVRSEIIWAKPNPMPESIKDRPATAHEKIFMLSKAARYFYDAASVRRPSVTPPGEPDENGSTITGGRYGRHHLGEALPAKERRDKQRGHGRRHQGFNERWDAMPRAEQQAQGRSLRNYEPAPVEVWDIATMPFSEAHFATFPPELAERCIKAGCPAGGTVLDPFFGAGTVGMVADRLQRDCIGIELNPKYVTLAQRRIFNDAPLLSEVAA